MELHPDPERIEDIRATPAPTNKASLQQYLGIATYMAPFIPQLADFTAPLRTRPHEIGHRLPVDYVISTGIRASSTSDYHSHYALCTSTKKSLRQYKLMHPAEAYEPSYYKTRSYSHSPARLWPRLRCDTRTLRESYSQSYSDVDFFTPSLRLRQQLRGRIRPQAVENYQSSATAGHPDVLP